MYISFLNQNNGEGQRISGINVMRLNFDFLIREFIHHREKRLVECLRMKSAAKVRRLMEACQPKDCVTSSL